MGQPYRGQIPKKPWVRDARPRRPQPTCRETATLPDRRVITCELTYPHEGPHIAGVEIAGKFTWVYWGGRAPAGAVSIDDLVKPSDDDAPPPDDEAPPPPERERPLPPAKPPAAPAPTQPSKPVIY